MAPLGKALGREALLFLLAVQFLARLPLPQHLDYSPARLGLRGVTSLSWVSGWGA